jgi:hypothetical protein
MINPHFGEEEAQRCAIASLRQLSGNEATLGVNTLGALWTHFCESRYKSSYPPRRAYTTEERSEATE